MHLTFRQLITIINIHPCLFNIFNNKIRPLIRQSSLRMFKLDDLVSEVLLYGIAIPILIGIAVTLALRGCLGATFGKRLAGLSVGVAFLIGYILLFGWADFPARSSGQKVVYLVLAGLVAGTVLDLIDRKQMGGFILKFVWPAAIIAWLGWPQLGNLNAESTLTFGLLYLGAVIVFDRLNTPGERHSNLSVALMTAAIGASFIAFIGASGSLSQKFAIVVAAGGGFLLCNWPTSRYPFSAAAAAGGGGAFVALATSVVLFSEVHLPSFAILALSFFAPSLSHILPAQHSDAMGPVIVGMVSAIPVVAGVGLALYIAGDSFELPF